MKITKNKLEKQANGESLVPDNISADGSLELVNRFFSPDYWEVKLKKSKDASNANYHVREWVKLTEKIKSNQPAINMGHKLAANKYWIEGSTQYITERLAEKKNTSKYKADKPKFVAKENDYRERYNKYKIPGYRCYGTSINEEFMRDPKNYRFEWHARNKSDGAKNKSGNYDSKCPPGTEKEKIKSSVRFVPKK